MKKKVKHRLTGSKPKPNKTGADIDGERVDSTGSRSASEPHLGGGPSAAADETESNWKSTTSATAKLLLRGVRDSADAFGPLKSVAGGLCFILENCEVWSPARLCYPMLTGIPENKGKYTRNRVAGTPS
jgi:hypothetical protein